MPFSGIKGSWLNLVASVVFAVVCLVAPTEKAHAVANLNYSTSFAANGGVRTYLDIGGTWNFTTGTDVTVVGDTLTLSISNTGGTDAFNLSITATVPNGFVLPSSFGPVRVTPSGVCPSINVNNAQQSGTSIDFRIQNNQDIPAGCSYDFELDITTNSSATPGAKNVVYRVTYDDPVATPQLDNVNTVPLLQVNGGNLGVNKTVTTASASQGQPVDFDVVISNGGTGGLFDVSLTDVLGTNLNGLSIFVPGVGFVTNPYTFDYIAAGQVINVDVDATVIVNPTVTSCPVLDNTAIVNDRNISGPISSSDTLVYDVAGDLTLTHNPASYCALCGDGTVRLLVDNVGDVTLTNISVTENLQATGLTYVPGTTFIRIDGGPLQARANPTGTPTVFTWGSGQIAELANLYGDLTASSPKTIEIYFDVRRLDEGLLTANKDIRATATYNDVCTTGSGTFDTGDFALPLEQPLPQVLKQARNVDAGQSAGEYTATVFGHRDDDVIWRVQIQNTNNLVDLEDVTLDDTITGNFDINYVCDSEGNASLAAAGTPPGAPNCVAYGGVQTVANFVMDDPFGVVGPKDVLLSSTEEIFYVGKITTECNVRTNTVDIEWGCEINAPPGGISSADVAGTVDTSSANLSTSGSGALGGSSIVTHTVRGVDGGAEIGSRGIVTIEVLNDTGGTIRNVVIDDILPFEEIPGNIAAQYVVDTTAPINFTYVSAYSGNYGGMADEMSHTIDLNPANLLSNTSAQFTLHSGVDVGDNPAVDFNLFRHGDSFTITYEIVLVEPSRSRFDRAADIDRTPEDATLTTIAPLVPTDPVTAFNVENDLTITYDDTCDFTPNQTYNQVDPFPVFIEDLDVIMSSPIYVLTDIAPVDLEVVISNNGGHVASNFFVYVAFGEAMTVNAPLPTGCRLTGSPFARPTWNVPDDIPQAPRAPTLVECSDTFLPTGMAAINPGTTRRLTFNVQKNAGAAFDDLTFRADVIGEIRLDNNTPLNLPDASVIITDSVTPKQIDPVANNYTQDAFRSRVIGFNLTKTQTAACTEDPPPVPPPPLPPLLPPLFDSNVTIGEDCTFHIEAGGWFGFDTPGFALIAVEDVVVTDDLPNVTPTVSPFEQGFISYVTNLTPGILVPNLPGPPINDVNLTAGAAAPLDESDVEWSFNPVGTGITNKDQWFRTDITTRILNDAVDSSAGPNSHGSTTTNLARASFNAVFDTVTLFVDELQGIPGYPDPSVRTIDLTVTEPLLTVTKQVCNETLNGIGPNCNGGVFADTVNDGDTNDAYIFKITVTNAAGRAPAFNIISTDTLDPIDLMTVVSFAGDNLDNDGDGATDEPDEASISIGDTTIDNGIEPVITVSHVTSTALARIDAGNTVTFYYRVDPDQLIAPLQTLTNSVVMQYDTLAGDFGNQNPPQLDNTVPPLDPNAIGRARIYNTTAEVANVIIQPLQTLPKQIIETSTTLIGGALPNVVVGEELRYRLTTSVPVAKLRDLKIVDHLPPGIRCVADNYPSINLNVDYPGAGFDPGGTFTPTCVRQAVGSGVSDVITWSFGDQELTSGPVGSRFTFNIDFVARVENSDLTREGDSFTNGGEAVGGTKAELSYLDSSVIPVLIVLPFDGTTVTVREPEILLGKTFTEANTDAGDVLTVTVTAQNTSTTVTTYNLQVLDNLVGTKLTYLGNLGGTDPPDNVSLVLGANSPIFSWNNLTIPAGNTISFTFEVTTDLTIEALERLDNTIQASWTSLPSVDTALNVTGIIGANGAGDGMRNGVLPNNPVDTINDYETSATDFVDGLPLQIFKTDLDNSVPNPTIPDPTEIAIGAHKKFRIDILLPEGTTRNVVVTDDLLSGVGTVSYVLAHNADYDITYSFPGIASINTAPPSEAAFNAFPAVDTANSVTWDIGTVVTQQEDDPTFNAITPRIRIEYFARAENVTPNSNAGDRLQNTAAVEYTDGELNAPAPQLTDATADVLVVEPGLIANKALVANITDPGNNPEGGDIVEYQLTVTNTGNSPAFDVNIVDNLHPKLQYEGSFTPTVFINAVAVPGFVPTPAGTPAGPLNWGRGNGDTSLDIPESGGVLVLTYRVVLDPVVEPSLTITNDVFIDWTSLDADVPVATDAYERHGNGCPTTVAPNTYCIGPISHDINSPPPVALDKQNTQATASIGEPFNYRILVPATPQPTALHDVRILDNLGLSAADLELVSFTKISGSQPWTPVNTGVAPNIIIEDLVNGIEIPANEQIEIELTVVLPNNTAVNLDGLPFNNTASYTFNAIDGDDLSVVPVAPDVTANMTIVEPTDVILDKTGPANLQFGTPGTFGLDVHNIGSGPAWDLVIVDHIPDPAQGGMCDTPPANITAEIQDDFGTTVRNLVLNTDYVTTFATATDLGGIPSCTFTLTMQTANARIEADNHLIVSYDATLDADNLNATDLTNYAAATQWFSTDISTGAQVGNIREYNRIFNAGNPGTPGTDDHEDLWLLTTNAPDIDIRKQVVNLTTGQNPGTDATPGDTLRYTITIDNSGLLDATNVVLTDAIPANASYVADSVMLNGLPVGQPDGGVSPLTTGVDVSSSDLTPPLPTSGNGVLSAGQSAVLTFDVLLDAAIDNGTVIQNQAQLNATGFINLLSDDPINGNDDPLVLGDEDTTDTLITSAPAFQVEKISTDLTGDPSILDQGDTLRYTITVKNIGTENSVNTLLRDLIPASTVYVSNSTRLNGVAVADPGPGVSALEAGMLINAPENTTAGVMRADTSATANNVATITFDVTISLSAVDGTIISNQGFVSGDGVGSGAFPIQPSDDPGTPIVDDPTIDIVGSVVLLDAQKTVQIFIDNPPLGQVDPGDTLRYTIDIVNAGTLDATGVTFTDAVPANTTYVANSVEMNGVDIGQPDAGVSPLVAGVAVSSSDLLPPLTIPNGIMSAGQSSRIIFDVTVNGGTGAGTIIRNQGNVTSNELPDELTDFDGNDANGDQPTDIVVGNVQALVITKSVSVVGGGIAEAGAQLEYVINVTNIGAIPATNVVITDDLDVSGLGYTTYELGSAQLDGSTTGTSFAAPILTADYSSNYGDLPPATTTTLRYRTTINAFPIGTTIINNAVVSWDVLPRTASTSVSIDIGGTPGLINLSGTIWHDADLDNAVDPTERLLNAWFVDVYRQTIPPGTRQLLGTVLTDSNGDFQVLGLPPTVPGLFEYELDYRAPGAGTNTALLGQASSPFTNTGLQKITEIREPAEGAAVPGLNLPIEPNGIVYDSLLRTPVAGARLTMLRALDGQSVSQDCFDDTAQQGQLTLASGYYKFDMNFSQGDCNTGEDFVIQVALPSSGFVQSPSLIIPPTTSATTPPYDVPACPGDAIPATANQCEVQVSEFQPPTSVAATAPETVYYLKLTLVDNLPSPEDSQLFNNHIPIDSDLVVALPISKVSAMVNVTRSQLVPYTITVRNTLPIPLANIDVVDTMPPGFKYVEDSARLNDVAVDPQANGREIRWPNLSLPVDGAMTIKLLLVVGSGVGEGEYVNTARAINNISSGGSGTASATVRVVPDPTFDCTDVIGKVFDDKNLNGYQDQGEKGLAGSRVVTARGLEATTDEYGRFHITCAVVPNQDRGSNFILKLDERSLPSGYRMTTENPRVQRATRGKMMKYNFGSAIHRVVRLDLADGVFEPNKTEMRPQWKSRMDLLLEQLQKSPSVLRLSYLAEIEDPDLVDDRLKAIKQQVSERWSDLNCCYKLMIETEVFWRRGGPPDRGEFDD